MHDGVDSTGLGPWRSGQVPGFLPFPDAALAGSVTHRFLAMARSHPDVVAVSSPAGRWTYRDMEDVVTRRASGLVERLGTDARPVAVLMTHDGPLVLTLLSVIAAGHIVVVLDPAAPEAQHHHVIGECAPALVLHDDAHADLARAAAAPTATPVVPAADIDADPVPLPERGPDDAMMLAFTSGTSGDPKGGIITHGVIVNLVRGATNALGITDADRMPMLFPTSLAVAAYPLFIPLLNGGTLATLDVRSVGLAPIADFLSDERITVAYLAPTVVRFLVDALGGREFPDLRLVALGGELVDAEVVALTRDLLGPDLLANGYGTTETGVIALHVIDPASPPSGAVPAGRPVPDVELIVLDDHGDPVPTGTTGEIAVLSPHVFVGYWGHPELNRQVLAADPAGRPGWRLYRTGDHGHLDEQGALVVSGRIDTRVKVRGRFVVLGDVEARLNEEPEVAAAAVLARELDAITELIAYVVPTVDADLDVTALRARLLETEEAYRVPSRWVVLDALPQLPNGKTDRRALPSPEAVGGPRPTTSAPSGAARHDEVRGQLLELWQGLLPIGTIGVDEDFFHLGGDSLLAAQMLVELEHRTGVCVPMGELVHARTVRSLAEVVLRLSDGAATSSVACVQPGAESLRPRLWFVHDLQGSAFRARHLARALGADQPVWSFESPLLAGEPNRASTLETFAAGYVRDLRRAQPEGPYWLAGYSFGGICAYEMARQLTADGEEVAFVSVIDVGPSYRGPGWDEHRSPRRPWFGVAMPPPPGTSLPGQVRHLVDLARVSRPAALRHLMERSGAYRWIDPLRFRRELRTHGRIRPEWRLWYAWEEHWKLAATAWERTRTYDGRMDLLWAEASAASDGTMGWGPLVGDLRIHRFAGDHEGALEPRGAPALGQVLRSALDEVIAER